MSCENASGTRKVSFSVCCGEPQAGGGEEGGGEEGGDDIEVETGAIQGSFVHGGTKRTYIVYVPENYEAGMPLLLNLHGYTMTAEEQMSYGDFRGIAEDKGFIIVHPQGTKDLRGKTHWNVGWVLPDSVPIVGGMPTSSTDDLGFLKKLIIKMKEDYRIHTGNVFSTGMSNGGFMSYHLACNGVTSGVASVTGSMSDATYNNCNGSKPVLDIHGTSDNVVAYDGSTAWNVSTPQVIEKWVQNNNCNETPTSTVDGDIQHDVYSGGTAVEHYKISGWGHDWPSWASRKVWSFFEDHIIGQPPGGGGDFPPAGTTESSKMKEHIGETYWSLLEPEDEEKGIRDLTACAPAISSPCDYPECES